MHIKTLRQILALQSMVALITCIPFLSLGAESTSYKLYTNFDESDATPLGSNSYSLDEGGSSWTTLPLKGNTFQIVTNPPTATSVSSSSSSSSSESISSTTGTTGGGGGGRGSRTPPISEASSEASSTSESSASSVSSVTSDPTATSSSSEASSVSSTPDAPLDANVVPPTDTDTYRPAASDRPGADGKDTVLVPGTTGEAGQCSCECPVLTTRCSAAASERLVRIPVLIPTAFQNPVPSMMIVIVAYVLGYFTKLSRSGQARVPGKSSRNNRKK